MSSVKMMSSSIRDNLKSLFLEGVAAVNPRTLVLNNLQVTKRSDGADCLSVCGKKYPLLSNYVIVGFGKAVLGMARTVEEMIKPHVLTGIISVPHGTQLQTRSNVTPVLSCMCIFEGAKNNLPDESAHQTAHLIAELVSGLTSEHILIALISGGGSALLPLPVPPITLDEKRDVIQLLANAGATIVELNCVRKKLSLVKGGGLAHLASPAQVISLIISDIVGDPIESIASGPTCPSTDPPNRAWEIIKHYKLQSVLPDNVLTYLTTEKRQCVSSSVTSEENNVTNFIIGNNRVAVNAVATKAESMNYLPLIMCHKIEGVAREVGVIYAEIVQSICELMTYDGIGNICKLFSSRFNSLSKHFELDITAKDIMEASHKSACKKLPLCLIFGGETTVNVSGQGKGGRNQELALSFAMEIYKRSHTCLKLDMFDICLLSAGTDGIDGPTNVAGALGYAEQIHQAKLVNFDPNTFLERNDSFNFFLGIKYADDLIVTGHTGTNVMDLHIIVISDKLSSSKA